MEWGNVAPNYLPSFMTSHEKGRPLPKFGEWDVNNPASADGFTVIFAKARDEKKANGTTAAAASQPSFDSMPQHHPSHENSRKKKWLCCI
ncbi:UNVERIFIED_CONTAM: protein NOI4 [Sesamum calycinum]|uniref:Protein NOI4 n=1 Tax=Sesamum calycinum TaxID=2727403 RepID=A0AAW2MN29_9LAMI